MEVGDEVTSLGIFDLRYTIDALCLDWRRTPKS